MASMSLKSASDRSVQDIGLQEKEKSLRAQESAVKEMEGSYIAKLQELDRRLEEKEALLSAHEAEVANLRKKA